VAGQQLHTDGRNHQEEKILNLVVVIVVVLWLLSAFGVLDSASGLRIGR
jgi:hypothetical protein